MRFESSHNEETKKALRKPVYASRLPICVTMDTRLSGIG